MAYGSCTHDRRNRQQWHALSTQLSCGRWYRAGPHPHCLPWRLCNLYILFGWFGRELLAFGTIVFAVFATGGQLLAGEIAIASLSNGSVCPLLGNGRWKFLQRQLLIDAKC